VNATALAHTMSVTLGITHQPITADQVTITGPDGYGITELDRDLAHQVASAVIRSFAADPESGDVDVRIISPTGGGASWRGHTGHTVRVHRTAR
jgi:hypothetical protein